MDSDKIKNNGSTYSISEKDEFGNIIISSS
jgi:hypothetical protein